MPIYVIVSRALEDGHDEVVFTVACRTTRLAKKLKRILRRLMCAIGYRRDVYGVVIESSDLNDLITFHRMAYNSGP